MCGFLDSSFNPHGASLSLISPKGETVKAGKIPELNGTNRK